MNLKSSKLSIYKSVFLLYNTLAVGGTNTTASRTTRARAAKYQSYDNVMPFRFLLCFFFLLLTIINWDLSGEDASLWRQAFCKKLGKKL